MNLSKITDFFTKNKKVILIAIIAFLFLFPDFVFADGPADKTSVEKGWFNTVITAINWLFRIVASILWLLTQIVGMFLTPAWTNGSVIGISSHIKDLWILISNIVYFIFAFLLIVIAFMNILWKWDKWELKQALPKFIVWVLIVPFSWFFVQFVVSLASILAASVLSLPFETLNETETTKDYMDKVTICTNWEVTKTSSECVDGYKKPIKEVMKGNGMYWLLNVYTYSIFEFDKVANLYNTQVSKQTINTITDLAVDTIFHILFVVVYLILVIALALALFTRVVWLWLYMIFSPVFWLLYFFDDKKDSFMDWKFTVAQFVWLAMVPVYVSAALSFWILFIFVAWKWMAEDPAAAVIEFDDIAGEKPPKSYIHLFPDATGGWFKVTYEWWNNAISAWDVNDVFDWVKWSFWLLLLQLFGLAVLWIAVMAALKWSKVTEKVVEPFAQFWKSIWDLAMKAPTYAPIIPSPTGWMMSPTALKSLWSWIEQHFRSKAQTRWSDISERLFWNLPKFEEALKQFSNQVDKANFAESRNKKYFNQLLANIKNAKTESAFMRGVKEMQNVGFLKSELNPGVNFNNVKDLKKLSEWIHASRTTEWKRVHYKDSGDIYDMLKADIDPHQNKSWYQGNWNNNDKKVEITFNDNLKRGNLMDWNNVKVEDSVIKDLKKQNLSGIKEGDFKTKLLLEISKDETIETSQHDEIVKEIIDKLKTWNIWWKPDVTFKS